MNTIRFQSRHEPLNVTRSMDSRRDWLLTSLERDWPAVRLGLHNGRKLNRLSTKQLEAKRRHWERMRRAQASSYVGFINSFAKAPF